MQEAEIGGYESSARFGLVAPAATPRDIVARVNAEVRILKLGDVKQSLAVQGGEPLFMTAESWARSSATKPPNGAR